ncbi:MAG: hypothetical protein QXN05_01795 [Acidilobaceae archaeon]
MWWLRLVIASSLATSLWMYLEFEVLYFHSSRLIGWSAGFSALSALSLVGLGLAKFIVLRYFLSRGSRTRAVAATSTFLLLLALFSLWLVITKKSIDETTIFFLYAISSIAQALIIPALIVSVLESVDFDEWVKAIATFYASTQIGVVILVLISAPLSLPVSVMMFSLFCSLLLLTSLRLIFSPPIPFSNIKSVSILVERLEEALFSGETEILNNRLFCLEMLRFSIVIAIAASLRITLLSSFSADDRSLVLAFFSIGSLAGAILSLIKAGFVLANLLVSTALLLRYLEHQSQLYLLAQLALGGTSMMLAQLSMIDFVLNRKPREALRSLSIASLISMVFTVITPYIMTKYGVVPLLAILVLTLASPRIFRVMFREPVESL